MFVKKGSREYQVGEACSDAAQRPFADKSLSAVFEDKFMSAWEQSEDQSIIDSDMHADERRTKLVVASKKRDLHWFKTMRLAKFCLCG